MRNRVNILALAAVLSSITPAMAQPGAGPYAPATESLRKHKVPLWFEDAKFGIFIHWGVFAVPAYHECYVEFISPKAGFGFLFGGPPYTAARGNLPEDLYRARVREDAVQYHIANWGADFAYDDFIPNGRIFRSDDAGVIGILAHGAIQRLAGVQRPHHRLQAGAAQHDADPIQQAAERAGAASSANAIRTRVCMRIEIKVNRHSYSHSRADENGPRGACRKPVPHSAGWTLNDHSHESALGSNSTDRKAPTRVGDPRRARLRAVEWNSAVRTLIWRHHLGFQAKLETRLVLRTNTPVTGVRERSSAIDIIPYASSHALGFLEWDVWIMILTTGPPGLSPSPTAQVSPRYSPGTGSHPECTAVPSEPTDARSDS